MGGPNPDPLKENAAGLQINVSINWRIAAFVESVASDGIHVYVGQNSSMISVPIAMPSNADALIKLAPPKKLIEKTQCRDETNLPRLHFYDHYDQWGMNCAFDFFLLAQRYIRRLRTSRHGSRTNEWYGMFERSGFEHVQLTVVPVFALEWQGSRGNFCRFSQGR